MSFFVLARPPTERTSARKLSGNPLDMADSRYQTLVSSRWHAFGSSVMSPPIRDKSCFIDA
jgi:hypothetical protein